MVARTALADFKEDAIDFATKKITVMSRSEISLNALRAAQHKPLVSSSNKNLPGDFSLYRLVYLLWESGLRPRTRIM